MDSHLSLNVLLLEELQELPPEEKAKVSPGLKQIIFNTKSVKPKIKRKLRRPKLPLSKPRKSKKSNKVKR